MYFYQSLDSQLEPELTGDARNVAHDLHHKEWKQLIRFVDELQNEIKFLAFHNPLL
jgi:hypothetical protein